MTNEQFEAFDPGYERSADSRQDSGPALGVSWHQAANYCLWYAEVSRKPMRLPSEIEWEYACMGGSEFAALSNPEDLDEMAWHAGNSEGKLQALDLRRSNGFGLYGMLGGTWEWVAHFDESAEEFADESAVIRSRSRILCGGSWISLPEEVTPKARRTAPARTSLRDSGFRVAKSLR